MSLINSQNKWGVLWAAALLLATAAVGCKSTVNRHGDASADVGVDSIEVMLCPPTDAPRLANKTNGETCCPGECASGFCVDGYCCDSACEATCMSCKLATSLGICTLTPSGVLPRKASQCPAANVTTCGLDGTCDGTGRCALYESGTECRPGICEMDAVTGVYNCDGAGACKLGAATVCAPFACSAATNDCFPTCKSDADCVSGRKCVNGSCGPKMNGAACQKGEECASGNCPPSNGVSGDGVCCNTSCQGACVSCNLVMSKGSCTPVAAGRPHALCPVEPQSTCGLTGICDGFGTCTSYPANTPCGASTCSGAMDMNTARTCDGLGTCEESEVQSCGTYRCAGGSCNSKCTTNADCADGIACVGGSCGPKVNGQPCLGDAECENMHCVRDTPTSVGVCCNTDCTGACRSCALGGGRRGTCTPVPAGQADPRAMCVTMPASTCGTDGRCDGAGACRHYAVGTTCAPETCAADVHTGQSTCNASGQCIRPVSSACFPYHCNTTQCFGSCTSNAMCIAPNSCGMNGVISSCGLKPPGASCSAANECLSNFCADGVCCNNSCNNFCQACNLAGTTGTCTFVNSGADPHRICATQAASTCGTNGQCASGQCARYGTNTQCMAPRCPSASTRTPPSMCNGSGTCVTPGVVNCAPGRCDTGSLTCNNTCTTDSQCTAPATCVNGSCGLVPRGGQCRATNQCQSGLTCYLTEGNPGVCCNSACTGTCESCRRAGSIGTCTEVPAGAVDPDPGTACVATANPASCGLNGRCSGDNTATNGAGTARCQFFGSAQGCRNRSCVNSTTGPSTETAAAVCNGAGACGPVVTNSCQAFRCAPGLVQCDSSCTTDAECVGVTCNRTTGNCGQKLGNGALCTIGTDCTSGNCVDGRCCNTACGGACQRCNNPSSLGTCGSVADGTAEPLCLPVAPPCGRTGLCVGGACANAANGTRCPDANVCDGTETCQAGVCSAGTPAVINDNNPCTADSCDVVTGIAHTPLTGTPCPDANLCNGAEMCRAGVCAAGTAVVCNAPPVCHSAVGAACAPATGICSYPGLLANGPQTGCGTGDANLCDGTSRCNAGTCATVGAVACTTPPIPLCHATTGTCTTVNGAAVCTYAPLSGAQAGCGAGDTNVCDGISTCNAGTCATTPAIVCNNPPAPVACHAAGTCNMMTGACTYANLNGPQTGCGAGDTNLCDGTSTCNAGMCATVAAVTCNTPPIPLCHAAIGMCNVMTGMCTYAALSGPQPGCGGTGDTNVCDGITACAAGMCNTTAAVVCNTPPDPVACHAATGTCMTVAGVARCTYAPQAGRCGTPAMCLANGMLKPQDMCSTTGTCPPATPIACDQGETCAQNACVALPRCVPGTTTMCPDDCTCLAPNNCNANGQCVLPPSPGTGGSNGGGGGGSTGTSGAG